MSLMAWNDKLFRGRENTIDQQHSGLFAIVNELHAAMMNGQGKKFASAHCSTNW